MEDKKSKEPPEYFQIKFSTLGYNEGTMTMVQLVEITDSILFNETRERNELLSMINATVSHEMRNPLNAISAQNMEKESIYSQIE